MTHLDVIQKCSVKENVIYLPQINLERNIYLKVAKALEHIGGKWNRKKQGFLFPTDPSHLLVDIGQGKQRNLKKELQFFETPDLLADQIVDLAMCSSGNKILEPSAGRGAIVRAMNRQGINNAHYVELDPLNLKLFQGMGELIHQGDFLKLSGYENYFDRILANPPFSKNQDIAHIEKMFELLAPSGRLVSIASTHFNHSTRKKEMTFKAWLYDLGAENIPLDAGSFATSGTQVATQVIIINKK